MRLPSVQAARQNTAFQRLFAFSVILALVSVVLLWPSIRERTGQAVAQAQDNNYQPFRCGQAGSTNPQQRRASLPLYNNAWDNFTAGRAYPCISGVQWKMEAGDTKRNIGTAGEYYRSNSVVALISKIYPRSQGTVYFAGSGSRDLAHLSLAALRFCSGTGAEPTNFVNGFGCTRRASGVKLYASSATSQYVRPKTPYVLNIVPNGPITVGGSNVLTDLWVEPSSLIAVPYNSMPLGATGCGSLGVGGNTYGSSSDANKTCEFTVSSLTGGLAQNLSSGGNFAVSGMNMTFYYLMSHTQGSQNPYNPNELSQNSIQLPNTRIKVGDGS